MNAETLDVIEYLQKLLDAAIAGQETLQKALAESQRREQAAIRDLRDNAYRSCYVCKNWVSGRCIREPKDCAGYNRWQWRGPQEGELNAETDNPELLGGAE